VTILSVGEAAGAGLVASVGLMVAVWLVSLVRRDASLIDRFWGLGFVVLAWLYRLTAPPGVSWEGWLLVGLVTVWGLRLSVYLTWRNWGCGEDPRYRAMRQAAGESFPLRSLVTVFLLQAGLLWGISLALLPGVRAGRSPDRLLVVAGVTLWMVGFAFESVGDWQLARFKADPAHRGRVLDRGVWRWTRHPNYFGDACLWWGFFACSAAAGGWWTAFAPVLMNVLLLRVSGVALLERGLVETKPAYRDYVARTSAFIPRPPKRVPGR
jgi:steroid 5-alpha reductase family enzyme